MRLRRWALPFCNVPVHPTCADYSIYCGIDGCQLRTAPHYTWLLCFAYQSYLASGISRCEGDLLFRIRLTVWSDRPRIPWSEGQHRR